MDIVQIMATIQHRYPFLLIDRITELVPDVRAVGLKNVTINEPFCRGHLPGQPMMPPVLIVEHAAQISCALFLSSELYAGKLGLFTGMEDVQFYHDVVPGDQLVTEVVIVRINSRTGKVRFTSRVENDIVAEGLYTFFLTPDPEKMRTAVAAV